MDRGSKCPHGYAAVLVEEDGWTVPHAPASCPACEDGARVGIPYKVGKPGEKPPHAEEPERRYVTCSKTPGCILVLLEGEEHTAPCLVERDEKVLRRAPKELPEP